MSNRCTRRRFLPVSVLAFSCTNLRAAQPKRMSIDETSFDAEPTPKQQQLIDKLTPAQLEEIDAALLSKCSEQWRKVARVAGTTLIAFNGKFGALPDVFFAKRVAALVEASKLQAQGNLKRMRFSEVRLPTR
jgi:Protein of unknown function